MSGSGDKSGDMSNLDALRQQVEAAPRDAALWFEYATCCLEDWALDEARGAYERVLEIEPANMSAQLELARTYYLSGNSSAAIVRCEAVLQREPYNGAAMLLMARVFFHDGDADSARIWLRRARILDVNLRDVALERELADGSAVEVTDSDQFQRRAQTQRGQPEDNETRRRAEDDQDPFSDLDDGGWEEAFEIEDFQKPTQNYSGVFGHEDAKTELGMKIVHPVKHPKLFAKYGKTVGGSVLLYGPSGCGKTMLAKATAGEVGARVFTISPHQLLDMYVGGSERNLHHLFELARRDSPSVIFIEEIDILVAGRSRQRSNAPGNQRGLLQQLLVELDNSDGKNEGVLIIGATSAPWNVDQTVRRPGRFDRALFIAPPEESTRAQLLEHLMAEKPQDDIDFALIAKRTRDFTGADLEVLVEHAIDRSLLKAMKTGEVLPLQTSDFIEAVSSIRPSAPEWFQRLHDEGNNMPSGWVVG